MSNFAMRSRILALIVVVGILGACSGEFVSQHSPVPEFSPVPPVAAATLEPLERDSSTRLVVELGMPFNGSDLAVVDGFISPFGVVRKSQDRPEFGHSGIDIPLIQGAQILAVTEGTIIAIEPGAAKFPGETVLLLIQDGSRDGEGWVFLVEHVDIAAGVEVGSSIARGQTLGTSTITTGRGNSHMQLTDYFNSFEFARAHTSWVDHLDSTALDELIESTGVLLNDPRLASSWSSATDENRHPLKGLLDRAAYPDGPQLCYPPGTDVRTPAAN